MYELEGFGYVLTRGVHGPGWVGLGDFFDPTQKFGLVGLVTQPNPLFSGWVRVGSGLGCHFFFFFFYTQFLIIRKIKYIKSSQTQINL